MAKRDPEARARKDAELREFKKQARARDIRSAKESDGVVIGLRLHIGEERCAICPYRDGEVVPIKLANSRTVPPYEGCEYPEGCEGWTTAELHPKFAGQNAPAKPPSLPHPNDREESPSRARPRRPVAVVVRQKQGCFSSAAEAFGWLCMLGLACLIGLAYLISRLPSPPEAAPPSPPRSTTPASKSAKPVELKPIRRSPRGFDFKVKVQIQTLDGQGVYLADPGHFERLSRIVPKADKTTIDGLKREKILRDATDGEQFEVFEDLDNGWVDIRADERSKIWRVEASNLQIVRP